METHLLIPPTLFATWVPPLPPFPIRRPSSLYHRQTPHGRQYHVSPPSFFRATNTEHTKPRALVHPKNKIYQTTCPLFHARDTEGTKPRAYFSPITCHAAPQKDIPIPYMALARHPLNITTLTIFFPFATIPAALHYFSTV